MFSSTIISKANSRIKEYAENNLKKINVKSKQGLFNKRCFYNAAQFSYDNPEYDVYEVICIGDEPILHYINGKDGEFFETTLGLLSNKYVYYLIRKIEKEDHLKMDKVFDEALTDWNKKFIGFYGRKILGIKRCL